MPTRSLNCKSCGIKPGLAESLLRIGSASGFTSVLNGRFKGGHITRQYGKPELGIQAIQLEMTQCIYIQERFDEYGGSISAEHGIGLLKKPFLGASRSESEIEAMRAIKLALDPKNLLRHRAGISWSILLAVAGALRRCSSSP